MSAPVNPILLYHTDAYQTARQDLKGRHSAGESFLTAFLAQASPGEVFALCIKPEMAAEFAETVKQTGRPLTPRSLDRFDRRLSQQGLLHLAHPQIAREARIRNVLRDSAYALCGITHTISSRAILEAVADVVVAPVMPWDAIICTSQVVQQALTVVMEAAEDDLRVRLGASRFSRPLLPVIPLGIHADRFRPSETHRKRWRSQLGLADDAVAILFFGRLSVHAKASPLQLAQAAQKAAQQVPHPLAIIWSGAFVNAYQRDAFMVTAKAMAPSVSFHHVDGTDADVRFSIWSAADIFCSLSDNVQETFGLTIIEAMAAELPVIASNWDGYRDTVTHGVNGIAVDSYFPAGSLADLAYRYVSDVDSYDRFIGTLSQYCFVDVEQTAHWIVQLAGDRQLRRAFAAAARRTVDAQFDWKAVLPRYRALWATQIEALEKARRDGGASSTLWKSIDPGAVFAGYPSHRLSGQAVLAKGTEFERWDELLGQPGVVLNGATLLTSGELRTIREQFGTHDNRSVDALLTTGAPERRPVMLRSLHWLVKVGLLRLLPEARPAATEAP